MKFFTKQGRTLILAAVVAAFSTGAFAQTNKVFVPFKVNVNATVTAVPFDYGVSPIRMTVEANVETNIWFELSKTAGVSFFGTQRPSSAMVIISKRSGKITLNLPTQSYRNAKILLYTVSGKRIMRNNVSATSTVNNISHQNLATGVYLLSVSGTDGNTLVSRLTHSGGDLNINVVFGCEDLSSTKRLMKEAVTEDWTITVSADNYMEYIDTVYTFRPVIGTNPLQDITLRKASSYESVVIGGRRWMKKNLNIETGGSRCYGREGELNYEANCAKYGRLYTWVAAKTACPAGWKLPSSDDWDHLAESVGGTKGPFYDGLNNRTWDGAGKKLKSKSGWMCGRWVNSKYELVSGNGTDDFGFSALPIPSELSCNTMSGDLGGWWTSGQYTVNRGLYRQTTFDYDDLSESVSGLNDEYSVRCVELFSDGGGPYESVEIGGTKWMKKNLNIETDDSESWCYDNSADNCAKYGRLYTWAAAKKVCPSGWRLPSRDDWDNLAEFVGGTKPYYYSTDDHDWDGATKKLKSKSGWNDYDGTSGNGTDDYGFSALPGGCLGAFGGVGAGNVGRWWTNTERTSGSTSYSRDMRYNDDYLNEDGTAVYLGLSVRCIEN